MQIVKKHQYKPSQQIRTSWNYVMGTQSFVSNIDIFSILNSNRILGFLAGKT